MTDHKFTDEEVIKAFNCCHSIELSCLDCPCLENSKMCSDIDSLAIDLIKRQEAKIKSLKKVLYELKKEAEMVYKQRDSLICQVNSLKKYDEERDIRLHARLTETARAEAIKEFAEKLKAEACYFCRAVAVEDIDKIVEELTETGDNNGQKEN